MIVVVSPRRRFLQWLGGLALVLMATGPAFGQADDIAGQWQCGGSRLSITRLGSLEIMTGDSYRAGLFKRAGDALEITWDGGGSTRIVIRRDADTLRVSGLRGVSGACTPRNAR